MGGSSLPLRKVFLLFSFFILPFVNNYNLSARISTQEKIIKCYTNTMSKDITVKLKRLAIIFKCLTDEKGKEFTAEELAKECNASYRTILRDISLIKKAVIELDSYNGKYSIDKECSFEKLGLTPQAAASLCLAYEAAKQAGKEFTPACKYIRGLLSPQTKYYEINPDLPSEPLVNKIQKAIKEKYYIKISSSLKNQAIYAKPYCLIRAKGKVDLIFICTTPHSSAFGYHLDYIPIRYIQEISFETKSSRVKNKHFVSLGVSKRDIKYFIKKHLELMLL